MIKSVSSNSSIFLLPEEKIILQVNPHWLFLALPLAGISFFFLFYFTFVCPFIGSMVSSFELSCYVLIFLILFFFSLVLYLDWKFNRLYLTNQRLIKERGIIGKRFMAIGLNKIQDITCSFGILGRIFGFGNLIIESAGTYGRMIFEGLPKPKRIKWEIEKAGSILISD
jgi:uncharacterized membrane protein YdbT with pleckstrin-like domain